MLIPRRHCFGLSLVFGRTNILLPITTALKCIFFSIWRFYPWLVDNQVSWWFTYTSILLLVVCWRVFSLKSSHPVLIVLKISVLRMNSDFWRFGVGNPQYFGPRGPLVVPTDLNPKSMVPTTILQSFMLSSESARWSPLTSGSYFHFLVRTFPGVR